MGREKLAAFSIFWACMDGKEALAWLAGRVLSAKRSVAEAAIFVPNANAVRDRLKVRAEINRCFIQTGKEESTPFHLRPY